MYMNVCDVAINLNASRHSSEFMSTDSWIQMSSPVNLKKIATCAFVNMHETQRAVWRHERCAPASWLASCSECDLRSLTSRNSLRDTRPCGSRSHAGSVTCADVTTSRGVSRRAGGVGWTPLKRVTSLVTDSWDDARSKASPAPPTAEGPDCKST